MTARLALRGAGARAAGAGYSSYGTAASGRAGAPSERGGFDTSDPRRFCPGHLRFWWRFWAPYVQLYYWDGPGQQLLNPGFEDPGSPPPYWMEGGGATATRDTSSPYEGAACARLTIPVGDDGGSVKQEACTVGARYRWGAACAGDGINGVPELYCGGTQWLGTASAGWQAATVDFTAASSVVYCRVNGNTTTEDYARFDANSLTEIPRLASADNDPALAALCQQLYGDPLHCTQALLANEPWYDPTGWNGSPCGVWNAVELHYMVSHAVAGAMFTGEDRAFMIGCAVRFIGGGSSPQRLMSVRHSTLSNPNQNLRNLGGAYNLYKRDDAGTTVQASDDATDDDEHTLIWLQKQKKMSLYLDGETTAIHETACDVGEMTVDRCGLGCNIAATPTDHADAQFRELLGFVADNEHAVGAFHHFLKARNPY